MNASWLNLGEVLKVNAKKTPTALCLSDAQRSFTYAETNRRVCQLANALLERGLQRGDKIAVFSDNSIEFCELYFAAAKAGLVVVPPNFRLVAQELRYVVHDSDAKAIFVMDEFVPTVEQIRAELPNIEGDHYFVLGKPCEGYVDYEAFVETGAPAEPAVTVRPEDPWVLLYTSGTTGRPKGVVRSHESYVAFYLINGVDFGFRPHDVCLTVMPLCHVNSTFFSFTFTYVGGANHIQSARFFQAEALLETIERHSISFISLVPTHYNMIFQLSEEVRTKYNVASIRKLLCSSAPARTELKKKISRYFEGVELYEGYGSTEAGIVTTLFPEEQLTKVGSIGRESCGTDLIKILDAEGQEVAPGEVGELYSRSPMMFSEYYKLPEVTKQSFRGEYFSAGDMARMDSDGYYYLVDRKNNMIITGGENVFPSEVEELLSQHPAVYDVAVIGLPHDKWGEMVTAVVVAHQGQAVTEGDLVAYCRERLAAYKRPKRIVFLADEEMPRTATGKNLHRVLRERLTDSGQG
jgi:acyl-CoA synthetase (AMP-forming)/AMP-acid ligase II